MGTAAKGSWIMRGAPSLIEEAVESCLKSARLPGVDTPYTGFSLVWRSRRYFVVQGVDKEGRARLVEVFWEDAFSMLEAVPAFCYPLPLCDVFPADFEAFYEVDPWGGPVGELTGSEIADGARILFAASGHEQDD